MSQPEKEASLSRVSESSEGTSEGQSKTRTLEPEIDPEKHLKRIKEAFQVSAAIQNLVQKQRQSPPKKVPEHDTNIQQV